MLFSEIQSRAYDKQFIKDLNEINIVWSLKDDEDFLVKYGLETYPDAFATFVTVGMYYDTIGSC